MKTLLIKLSFIAAGLAYSGLCQADETCTNIYKQIIEPYIKLYFQLPPGTKIETHTELYKMLTMKPNMCESSSSSQELIKTVVNALGEYTPRIGVLLPLSGPKANDGQAILTGIKGALANHGANFDQRVVVRDTRALVPALETQLAEMIFKYQVGVLIGGFTRAEAHAIEQWSEILRIPSFVVNQKDETGVKPYVFHVFPQESHMVAALADQVKLRGLKSVAILRPTRNDPQSFAFMFEQALKARGISVPHSYTYNGTDFSSMQAVSEKIFHIDTVERASEWQEALREGRRRAARAKLPFNPQMVALPPRIEVDAIFIDDNFRSVRHFSKIFKYLGVDKMTMLGTAQWRSRGLIEPPEPFLEGAAFVDYVGSYRDLPQGVFATGVESRYFIDPSMTSIVDYQVIGNQAGRLADKSLLGAPEIKRRLLPKKIEEIANDPGPYFASGRAFDDHHVVRWPAYLFQVSGGTLQPIKADYSDRQAARDPQPETSKTSR